LLVRETAPDVRFDGLNRSEKSLKTLNLPARKQRRREAREKEPAAAWPGGRSFMTGL
jgi:hypothetical protein